MNTRRSLVRMSAALLATSALSAPVLGQQFPAKPIRTIIPFTPGSTTDVFGRIVAEGLSASLGQPIIIENRSGAGGSVGSAVVARADADGYTWLMNAAAHSASLAAFPNAPYHPGNDFAGVAVFGVVPNVLVISPEKGLKTVKALMDAARKNDMTFASAGNGTSVHIAGELLKSMADVDILHVPYKGGVPALNDLMGGQVSMIIENMPQLLPQVWSRPLPKNPFITLHHRPLQPDLHQKTLPMPLSLPLPLTLSQPQPMQLRTAIST
jgi:tripartite-type tricarboxylate transporter receptor subunit TctC